MPLPESFWHEDPKCKTCEREPPLLDQDQCAKCKRAAEAPDRYYATFGDIFKGFPMGSTPPIPLSQIKERRFDLIEEVRNQSLASAQIQAAEDARIFEIIDAITRGQERGTNPKEDTDAST